MAKKKTERQRLVKVLDELCKQIVRLRDEWTCQRCEIYLLHDTGDQKKFAHTGHIVSRSRYVLRWDLLNLVLFCHNCHRWAHRHPLEVREWFKNKWVHRYDYCMSPAHKVVPVRTKELKELKIKLKQKLEDLESEARND